MNTIVINRKHESEDIYIGRGSVWGNPYRIGPHGSRAEVILKYKRHLWHRINTGEISKEDLIKLHGKKLGCFCKPEPCHGDILVNAINWAVQGDSQ